MSTKILRVFAMVCVAIAVAAVSSGCKGKKNTPIDPSLGANTGAGGGAGAGGDGTGLPNLNQEEILWGASGLQNVYFDYDSSSLRQDALATLADNAAKINQTQGVVIQIEGHCDERGTQDYNFALGEKRALSVREHLIRLGVDGSRLLTISYGEEDPAQPGHDESAWSQNRRCEFNKGM